MYEVFDNQIHWNKVECERERERDRERKRRTELALDRPNECGCQCFWPRRSSVCIVWLVASLVGSFGWLESARGLVLCAFACQWIMSQPTNDWIEVAPLSLSLSHTHTYTLLSSIWTSSTLPFNERMWALRECALNLNGATLHHHHHHHHHHLLLLYNNNRKACRYPKV